MSVDKEASITFVIGTGGVGKTTLSASYALQRAKMGRQVLLITIDPSKRLAQALGISKDSATSPTAPFDVVIPNAEESFNDFIHSLTTDPSLRQRLKNQSLLKSFATENSGATEYFALEILDRAIKSKKYDEIILDTPPYQHTFDFFDGPEKLIQLYESNVLRAFVQQGSSLLALGLKKIMSLFKAFLGDSFFTRILEFAEVFLLVQKPMLEKLKQLQKWLESPETSLIIVTQPTPLQVSEMRRLKEKLEHRIHQLRFVFINKIHPLSSHPERDLKDSAFLNSVFSNEAGASHEIEACFRGPSIRIAHFKDVGPMRSGLEELHRMSETMPT